MGEAARNKTAGGRRGGSLKPSLRYIEADEDGAIE